MTILQQVERGQFFFAPEIGGNFFYQMFRRNVMNYEAIRYINVNGQLKFDGIANFNHHDSGAKEVIIVDVKMETDL